MAPRPKRRGILGELLLERVGGERPEHRAVAGQDAEDRAEDRAAQDRAGRTASDPPCSAAAGRSRRARRRASPVCSRLRRISAKPNMPMASTAKSMPSESAWRPKVMRSCAGLEVGADGRRAAARAGSWRSPSGSSRARARRRRRGPCTISEKYSAGPKSSASLVSGAPSAAMTSVATRAGEERADGRDAERHAGAALLGHLVAVERR